MSLAILRIILIAIAVIWCQSHFAVAFADGNEDIAIRSFNSTGDGILGGKTQKWTLFVIWILVVGILTIGILSTSSRGSTDKLIRLGKGPDASNLFLGIRYGLASDAAGQSGYIRSLGMKHATFVSSQAIAKRTKIRFDFSTLPGFEGTDHVVEAEVLRSRPMAKDTKHFLMDVRLDNMSPEARSSLTTYLQQLNSRNNAYNRA